MKQTQDPPGQIIKTPTASKIPTCKTKNNSNKFKIFQQIPQETVKSITWSGIYNPILQKIHHNTYHKNASIDPTTTSIDHNSIIRTLPTVHWFWVHEAIHNYPDFPISQKSPNPLSQERNSFLPQDQGRPTGPHLLLRGLRFRGQRPQGQLQAKVQKLSKSR